MGTPIATELPEVDEQILFDKTLRCDRCQAQAFVWVNGLSGDLAFCGHHFAKWEDAIRNYAFEIQDERHTINNKPSSSANV